MANMRARQIAQPSNLNDDIRMQRTGPRTIWIGAGVVPKDYWNADQFPAASQHL